MEGGRGNRQKKYDNNKMFIRYENLTGNFIGFFSSLDKQHTHTPELMVFLLKLTLKKGKGSDFCALNCLTVFCFFVFGSRAGMDCFFPERMCENVGN